MQPAFLIYMAFGAIISLLAIVPMTVDHHDDHDGVRAVPRGEPGKYPNIDVACNAQV